MKPHFDNLARMVAHAAGRPGAFIAAVALVAGWAAVGPVFGWSDSHSLFVNTATTIVTFLMVFLIQGAQNREEAAMQAKLDELIRAIEGADDRLRGIERRDGFVESDPQMRDEKSKACPVCGEYPGQCACPV